MLELPNRFAFRGHEIAWGAIGAGAPLVLVHGTPFSSQVWRKIAPLLAQRWRVHYFDLLGYGASMAEGEIDVSLGVQNELLAALCAEWDLREPELLAHDFGGATALRGHFLNGLRYRRLTLIDPVAVAPWGSPFVAHVRHHQAAFAGLPAYAHDALLAAYLQGAAHLPLSPEALETYAAPWRGALGQAGFYRQIAQMDQRYTDAVEPLYPQYAGEVRLLWGAEDAWIPPERGRALAAALRCQITMVEKAGHLVQDDAPEAVVAAMLG
ncbi:MAG: alpha/beta hydrolase [Pseudomonadota bacterium]